MRPDNLAGCQHQFGSAYVAPLVEQAGHYAVRATHFKLIPGSPGKPERACRTGLPSGPDFMASSHYNRARAPDEAGAGLPGHAAAAAQELE